MLKQIVKPVNNAMCKVRIETAWAQAMVSKMALVSQIEDFAQSEQDVPSKYRVKVIVSHWISS